MKCIIKLLIMIQTYQIYHITKLFSRAKIQLTTELGWEVDNLYGVPPLQTEFHKLIFSLNKCSDSSNSWALLCFFYWIPYALIFTTPKCCTLWSWINFLKLEENQVWKWNLTKFDSISLLLHVWYYSIYMN